MLHHVLTRSHTRAEVFPALLACRADISEQKVKKAPTRAPYKPIMPAAHVIRPPRPQTGRFYRTELDSNHLRSPIHARARCPKAPSWASGASGRKVSVHIGLSAHSVDELRRSGQEPSLSETLGLRNEKARASGTCKPWEWDIQ